MYGDNPPTIVAIDGSLIGTPGLGGRMEAFLQQRPAWFVAEDAPGLALVLEKQGIVAPIEMPDSDVPSQRRTVAVIAGGMREAVDAAIHRHTRDVRLWLGRKVAEEEMDMDVRIAAHDAGIQLRIEAPLEGA